jgi:oxygen-independent coproporphyrinogen-3 oxidase
MAQSARAAALIREAGYEAIGLDHFALPGDSLALAARRGALRRNFQGYTDDGCETLIGLGPSSISGFRDGYAQNAPAIGIYRRAIEKGMLPVVRGFELSGEDRVRAWVIERLMCDFGFSADEASGRFGEDAEAVVDEARQMCDRFPDVLSRQGDSFTVQPQARAHVRSVAAGFDSYLGRGAARHSMAV